MDMNADADVNKRSGDLCFRPAPDKDSPTMDPESSSIDVETIDSFFVGKIHPIDYSPEFKKCLKETFEKPSDNLNLNLLDGSNNLDEKPIDLSFNLLLNHLLAQREHTQKSLSQVRFSVFHMSDLYILLDR